MTYFLRETKTGNINYVIRITRKKKNKLKVMRMYYHGDTWGDYWRGKLAGTLEESRWGWNISSVPDIANIGSIKPDPYDLTLLLSFGMYLDHNNMSEYECINGKGKVVLKR